MLRLLNKDRKKHGLLPVRMQSDLRVVARKHSMDMAQKDYFDHVNMKAESHVDRMQLRGVTDAVSGENLAKIGGYSNPTQFAEEGLMNSPGHRANILNGEYNAVGIGVVRDSRKVYYFTQNFAKRDLIFNLNIPKSVRLRTGLLLRGKAYTDVDNIFYQVKNVRFNEIENQRQLKINAGSFNFKIQFSKAGEYEVLVWVSANGDGGKFFLANSFKLLVKKGFWF